MCWGRFVWAPLLNTKLQTKRTQKHVLGTFRLGRFALHEAPNETSPKACVVSFGPLCFTRGSKRNVPKSMFWGRFVWAPLLNTKLQTKRPQKHVLGTFRLNPFAKHKAPNETYPKACVGDVSFGPLCFTRGSKRNVSQSMCCFVWAALLYTRLQTKRTQKHVLGTFRLGPFAKHKAPNETSPQACFGDVSFGPFALLHEAPNETSPSRA